MCYNTSSPRRPHLNTIDAIILRSTRILAALVGAMASNGRCRRWRNPALRLDVKPCSRPLSRFSDALRELFWRALPARFAQLIVGSKLCTVSDRLGAGDVNRRARHPYSPTDGAHSAKASLGRRVGTICSSFGSQHLHLGSI